MKDILNLLYCLAPIVFYLVSTLAIIGSYISFNANSRLRRLQWLSTLYQQFFQAKNYKRIRRIIDYNTTELKTIESAIEADCDHLLVEMLVDYLNFFEFVASLWKSKEINKVEVSMLFEYYIVRLRDFDFLVKFIEQSGFENLRELLNEFPMKAPVPNDPGHKSKIYYLFVYGTLRKLTAFQTHRLLLPSTFIQQGYFMGKLYDIGDYPGAVRGSDLSEVVTGEVYLLHDQEKLLQQLDRYEGCTDADPNKEYKREIADIQLKSGEDIQAWIYIYQDDTASHKRIESGDYKDYIESQRSR